MHFKLPNNHGVFETTTVLPFSLPRRDELSFLYNETSTGKCTMRLRSLTSAFLCEHQAYLKILRSIVEFRAATVKHDIDQCMLTSQGT